MNGIKMSDCRFYVNEADRIVVCVIPSTKYMVTDFITDHFDFPGLDLSVVYGKLAKEIEMPASFIGIAKCSPDDEWNEELGRMIAFSRAKDKCYRSFFKRANTYIQKVDQRLNDAISILNDFGTKLSAKKDDLESMIESKIQKE